MSNAFEAAYGVGAAAADTAAFLSSLGRECVAAGANVIDINLQRRHDNPRAAEMAVKAVQSACECQVCLSCGNPETLEAGLKACQRPPIVNYVSMDKQRLDQFLPLAARYRADLVLLLTDPLPPSTPDEALGTAAVLIGAANEAGIPNERILIDPGVLHVTYSAGQRHVQSLFDLIPALADAFEPAIRTTCWVENVSSGASKKLRPFINCGFLGLLSGLGVSSVFMDVLEPQAARTMRLMRIFCNELIFSEAELDRRSTHS
ncbi:MAG: dihydropteroate synthase [Chloroflexi bacterium]|nr:dihydropteroate synthase [Chloroflexota bacterium]